MIGRILLTLAALMVSGFLLLVLIGLRERYEHETGASGFGGIYERDFASQVDPAEHKSGGEQLTRHEGPRLVGTGEAGSANQGVALSADGDTAIAGGPGPNNGDRDRSPSARPGALDFNGIYERDFASQVDPADQKGGGEQLPRHEAPKLVGTGAMGSANQGISVSLSADGNTAIVGGPGPNNGDRDRSPSVGPAGATWVFTRSGGIWSSKTSSSAHRRLWRWIVVTRHVRRAVRRRQHRYRGRAKRQ